MLRTRGFLIPFLMRMDQMFLIFVLVLVCRYFFILLIYGPIEIDIPVNRIGFLGNYFLDGNLIIWSLIILFVFTSCVSIFFILKVLI